MSAAHEELIAQDKCFTEFKKISIDPFHVCGNAAKLEDKTKEIFASVKQSYCSVLQIGCIPTDVKGVYKSFNRSWSRTGGQYRFCVLLQKW